MWRQGERISKDLADSLKRHPVEIHRQALLSRRTVEVALAIEGVGESSHALQHPLRALRR